MSDDDVELTTEQACLQMVQETYEEFCQLVDKDQPATFLSTVLDAVVMPASDLAKLTSYNPMMAVLSAVLGVANAHGLTLPALAPIEGVYKAFGLDDVWQLCVAVSLAEDVEIDEETLRELAADDPDAPEMTEAESESDPST